MPCQSSSDTSVPGVATSGVNEWPLPATRTPPRADAAPRTTAQSSASDFGRARLSGLKATRPEKFDQASAAMRRSYQSAQLESSSGSMRMSGTRARPRARAPPRRCARRSRARACPPRRRPRRRAGCPRPRRSAPGSAPMRAAACRNRSGEGLRPRDVVGAEDPPLEARRTAPSSRASTRILSSGARSRRHTSVSRCARAPRGRTARPQLRDQRDLEPPPEVSASKSAGSGARARASKISTQAGQEHAHVVALGRLARGRRQADLGERLRRASGSRSARCRQHAVAVEDHELEARRSAARGDSSRRPRPGRA